MSRTIRYGDGSKLGMSRSRSRHHRHDGHKMSRVVNLNYAQRHAEMGYTRKAFRAH